MNHARELVLAFIAGAVLFGRPAYRAGQQVQRTSRAWLDVKTTRATIGGLLKNLRVQAVAGLKYALVLVLVVVGAVFALVNLHN